MSYYNGKKILGVVVQNGGGGGTTVTVDGEAVETFNADTKVDELENDTDSTMLYAERAANGGTYLVKMSYTQANSAVCVRSSTGYVRAQTPETGNDYDLTNRKFVNTVSKYYSHEIQIQSMTFMGFIVLQVLSRQPNMYTSLADMVADSTLILPRVADCNEQGDPKIALNPSITDTGITWVGDSNGGNSFTISTTDDSYSFVDSVKPYEIPTT